MRIVCPWIVTILDWDFYVSFFFCCFLSIRFDLVSKHTYVNEHIQCELSHECLNVVLVVISICRFLCVSFIVACSSRCYLNKRGNFRFVFWFLIHHFILLFFFFRFFCSHFRANRLSDTMRTMNTNFVTKRFVPIFSILTKLLCFWEFKKHKIPTLFFLVR